MMSQAVKNRLTDWRESALQNKAAKAIALFLAVLSWYAVREAISFESIITDIPLSIEVDEGWAVQELSPSTVDIVFRGSQDDLRKLTREQTSVMLDLKGNPPEGATLYELDPAHVRTPHSVRAVEINPAQVEIVLDREEASVVPVKVNIRGELPTGYEVVKAVCSPATVKLTGPRMRLADVESVRTAPLDMEGRLDSFKIRMQVMPPSPNWVAAIEPEKVMVEIDIVERATLKEIKDLRVRALITDGGAGSVRLTPAKVDVVLKGRAEVIEAIENEGLSAYVDCTRIDPGIGYDLPVQVHPPQGVDVERITPSVIKVTAGSL